jgi:hypothetical protein
MKRNGKKSKKIRKLIIASTLSAIVLIVSTYTWFIGMQTVSVDPFEINIASTEGLFLSLDGENWYYQLDNISTMKAYEGNTNNFENQGVVNGIAQGLIPMSSVGDLDPTVSRMKLFDKGSLTTSPGGYRLLSGRVNNYEDGSDADSKIDQGDGYIVFDLFVKNLSGNEYYTANQPLNEEAIYLTTDSAVKVFTTGAETDQEKTGIENSVRVGFTQLGRVKATTESVETITKMDCNISTAEGATNGKPVYTESTGVTGICRNAQIWEPNDTKHVQNAINFYAKSCAKRLPNGDNVTLATSYVIGNGSYSKLTGETDTGCLEITKQAGSATDYNYVPTYAISRVLGINDNVDIYDGPAYNQYSKNTTDYATYESVGTKDDYKLVKFPYFTDTMKNTSGNQRPEFMTLAPNSITKLRVYIWIEGQDIDNYNFAIMGRKISVNFGFTKERYDGDGATDNNDVEYDGPSIPATADNSALPATGEAQS